jgi:hypothetical protein
MRKFLLVLVVIGIVVYFGKGKIDEYFGEDQPIGIQRSRVAAMLQAMAEQPPDEQRAVSLWGEGVFQLDFDGLRRYDIAFGRFWKDSGLAAGSGWKVVGAKLSGEPGWVHVTVGDGATRITLAAAPREPLRLVETR